MRRPNEAPSELQLQWLSPKLPRQDCSSRSERASSADPSIWQTPQQDADVASQIEIAPQLASLIECERAVARATMATARQVADYRVQTILFEMATGQTWFAATLLRHLGGKSGRQCDTGPALPDELRRLTCVQSLERMSTVKQLHALAQALRRINVEIGVALAHTCSVQWNSRLWEMRRTHDTSAAQCRYLARLMTKEAARD